MADERAAKTWAAASLAAGVIWITLTGGCTWAVSTDHYMGGVWPLGLWFVSWGIPPLAIGLRPFAPARRVDRALWFMGIAWLVVGAVAFAVFIVNSGVGPETLGMGVLVWPILLLPGFVMLSVGRSGLRSKD